MQSLDITLSSVPLTITQLSVAAAEAVATEFTPEQLQHSHQHAFGRALIAASITAVRGRPVSPEIDIRSIIPSYRDWQVLDAIYQRLNRLPAVLDLLPTINPESTELTVTLPSGRVVTLRALTLQQVEDIEITRAHTSREFLRRRHDIAAAMINAIDNTNIAPSTDLRVELPLFTDWNALSLIYDRLHQPQDIDAFFPKGLDLRPITATSPSLPATLASPSPNSSDAPSTPSNAAS